MDVAFDSMAARRGRKNRYAQSEKWLLPGASAELERNGSGHQRLRYSVVVCLTAAEDRTGEKGYGLALFEQS